MDFQVVLQVVIVSIFRGEQMFSVRDANVIRHGCPESERFNYKTGRYPYPTVVFQVWVDHTRLILAAEPGHHGNRNDKSIARLDPFLTSIRNGIYANIPFRLFSDVETSPGVFAHQDHIGLWTMTDGG
jgi:hypothetical protein